MVLRDPGAPDERISIRAIARTHPRSVLVRIGSTSLTAADLASRAAEPPDDETDLGDGVSARVLGSDVGSVLAVVRAFEGPGTLVALHPRWPSSERNRRLATLDAATTASLVASHAGAALVCFTSGTSGAGAAVLHGRRAIALAALASLDRIQLAPDDRCLLSMPLAHVGGASIVARCLAARASIVIDETTSSFDAARWIDVVRSSGVTHASIVPTMLKRIVDSGLAAPDSLKRVVVGGAACDATLARDAIRLGYPVVCTYGMTETFAMVSCESTPGEGGCGRPLPGCEVRSVDGELRVRTASIALGFVPERPLPLDEFGFLRTRDSASIDAAGCLHVHGRTDDVVITGGENVHPSEVEAALLAVQGVDAAVVFGEPDVEWGQALVAVYAGSIDVATLGASLRDRLPGHARPKRVVQLGELPMLPSGKVDRAAARALAR